MAHLGLQLPGGRAAGQQVELLATLRNLIRDYPAGIGVVKELLQNADDAGATWLRVVFDRRTHRGAELPGPFLGLMGPALLFESDQVFTEANLAAIRSIGAGSKLRDVERTGQFGRGFNTVYTVTDYPAFVTRDLLCCFDPFDDVVSASSGDHGTEWSLKDVGRSCPTWLRAFGLAEGVQALDRTVFRLPLRTTAQASADRLKDRPFTPEEVLPMLQEVETFGPALLLFLRHVRHLDVSEVSADGREHRILSIRTENEDEVELARATLRLTDAVEVEQHLAQWRRDPSTAPRALYSHAFSVGGRADRREAWLVSQSFEPGPAGANLDRAQEMLDIHQKAVPKVGVACRVDPNGSPMRVDGRLFCTLPLPISSGLPFHVNGFFDLDSSRRALTVEGGAHDVRVRTAWNESLAVQAAPTCAGALFRHLLSQSPDPNAAALYAIWPSPPAESQAVLAGLARGIIREFASQPSVRVRAAGRARWVRPVEAIRPRGTWSAELTEALRADGLELVDPALPEDVFAGLTVLRSKPEVASPAQVSAVLKRAPPSGAHHTEAPLRCLRDRRGILALADLFKQAVATDLEGLPLSLRGDGSLFALASNSTVLDADLEVRELAARPGWFLEVDVINAFGGTGRLPGLVRIEAAGLHQVLRWLHETSAKADLPPWRTAEHRLIDSGWLERVIGFLTRHPPTASQQALGGLPLVVDQEGNLRTLYAEDSPCDPNPRPTSSQLVALSAIGVPMTGGTTSLRAALAYLVTRLHGSPLPTVSEAIARRVLAWSDRSDLPEQWGELMDLLAEAHLRQPLDAHTLQRLAAARIWPTQSGPRAVTDPQVYLAAGFQAPGFGDDVHLLALGIGRVREQLFRALGAAEFTLDQFIRRTFIQRFPSLDAETRQEALTWLSDPARRAHLGEVEGLRKDLGRAVIAPTSAGGWVTPKQIYHPEATETHALLADRGPALRCPEAPLDKAWQELFAVLGMVRSPRPRQLLLRLTDLVQGARRRGELPDVDALHACFTHVAQMGKAAWVRSVDGRPLGEQLAELAWLPALRGDEARTRFGVLLDVEERLFRPAELFRIADGFLVASQEPLCAFSADHGLLEEIGIRTTVPLTIAREHFKAVRDAYRGQSANLTAARHTANSFYAHLGKSMAESAPGATSSIRHAMGGPDVIWDDASERFWRADHCFALPAGFFLSLRAHVPGDGHIGAGMDLLGRRAAPDTRDLVAYLDDLGSATRGRALQEEERASALHVLMELLSKLRAELPAPGADWHGLHQVQVLDQTDRLRRAVDVLREDAPWWVSRIDRELVALLHEQVGDEFARFAGVSGVATTISEELVERTPASTRDTGPGIVCQTFSERLSSASFEMGLRRLIFGEHQNLEPPLVAVLGLQFDACASLTTELTGAPLAPRERFGRENVEVYLVDDRMYVAGGSADNVLPDVALALNRRLGALALKNLAPLEEILRVPVTEIAARLDRRRVPPLPEIVEPPTRTEWKRDALGAAEGSGARPQPQAEATPPDSNAASNGFGKLGSSRPGSLPFGSGQRDSGPTNNSPEGGSNAASGEAPPTPSIRPRDGRPRLLLRHRGRRLITYLKAPAGRNGGSGASSDVTAEQIDSAALERAREYEARSDVPDARVVGTPIGYPGFDLLRTRDDGEPERVIEVKGIAGAWDARGVGLRPAQARAAWELDDRYWVYVVEHATDPTRARVHALQNPIKRSTAFQIDAGWGALAERAPDEATLPVVGGHLYRGDSYLGAIESVDPSSADGAVVVRVRNPDGELRDRVWSRSRHTIELEKR